VLKKSSNKKDKEEAAKVQRKSLLDFEKKKKRGEKAVFSQAKAEAAKLREAEEASIRNAKKLDEQRKKAEDAK